MENEFRDKIILVTGGTGTIGSALVERLLLAAPRQVRVLSRDETKQSTLLEHLNHPANLRLFIGDVRDRERLALACRGVDIVFHAAALKHVPFCEYNPFEAVKTNVIGSQNVIDAALQAGVAKVVAISTDKVVNPAGVMGVSKLMMEKLFLNANYYKGDSRTAFSCVRFGNIAWSRGSVLCLWKAQAEREGAIRLTDGAMTRFLMSRAEAIDLVFAATRLMRGGEIFIFKMPSVAMRDLGRLFLEKYFPGRGVAVTPIGVRSGEKLHEELLGTPGEATHVFENQRMFILVPRIHIYGLPEQEPPAYPGFSLAEHPGTYSSKDFIDLERISRCI